MANSRNKYTTFQGGSWKCVVKQYDFQKWWQTMTSQITHLESIWDHVLGAIENQFDRTLIYVYISWSSVDIKPSSRPPCSTSHHWDHCIPRTVSHRSDLVHIFTSRSQLLNYHPAANDYPPGRDTTGPNDIWFGTGGGYDDVQHGGLRGHAAEAWPPTSSPTPSSSCRPACWQMNNANDALGYGFLIAGES